MSNTFEQRNPGFIRSLYRGLWPCMKVYFRFRVKGVEHIPHQSRVLYIANHNSGAVVESHSMLFTLLRERGMDYKVYGFTHPSIFKIPLMKRYFELIGAVPADKETAHEVFSSGHALMIFPGGNRQAFRPLWQYKENDFLWAHGWAALAVTHQVPVTPVTFKGSHFINPIFLSGQWVSKILILPALLGIKWATVSLGQILCALVCFFILKYFHAPILINAVVTYLVFIISPLTPVLPSGVTMEIHPAIMPESVKGQKELEERMAEIMNGIYSRTN